MDWSPNTSQKTRVERARMLHTTRSFFFNKNVLEVETPALSQAGNTDPHIESIQSTDLRYLNTSPEYPMKRLLASGSGDIYQISKVWRAAEIGRNHNPEFSLLEWYRVGFVYHELMQEVSDLLHSIIVTIKNPPQFISYKQLFLDKFSINPHISNRDGVLACVKAEIPSLDTETLDQQNMLDALLTHCIEPEFATDCLTFVYDYPASQSALAQLRDEEDTSNNESVKYAIAERFEVYLGELELGNGYQEEVGAERNKTILESENITRTKLGLKTVTKDDLFLEACESGIPTSAGVAIGLDRVLMGITGEKSIQKVINFPWDKA